MKLIINSDMSLVEAVKQIKDDYSEHKWVGVTVNAGTRTLKMNAWIAQAYKMLSIQGDLTILEYRCYCKFTLGLPILMEAHPDEAEPLKAMLKSVSYENKLKFMLHYPVTSRFTIAQGTQYIQEMIAHYSDYEMPHKDWDK